jgi:YggT family protein
VRRLYDGLSRVIDPILRPIRSVMPPVRLGNAALDLSPLVLVLGVTILLSVIC